MLGHTLHQTRKFGFPLEYANGVNLAEWKKRFGVSSLAEVLAELQRRRTSPNGVFGIKIHYKHLKMFGGFNNLLKMFPGAYYVLISRRDVLGQAISWSVARQTGVWISGMTPKNKIAKYSFARIDECLRSIILDTASWRHALAAGGCRYIELTYEDFLQDPAGSSKAVARFMDVDLPSRELPQKQATRKQASEKNDEWRERFLSDANLGKSLSKNKHQRSREK
jgi:LPS sulfotransferase NodH